MKGRPNDSGLTCITRYQGILQHILVPYVGNKAAAHSGLRLDRSQGHRPNLLGN